MISESFFSWRDIARQFFFCFSYFIFINIKFKFDRKFNNKISIRNVILYTKPRILYVVIKKYKFISTHI